MYEGLTVEAARIYHQATYSIVAAQSHPDLTATVFDLPPVAEVAREFIERAGVSAQVQAVGGDFTRDAFPTGIDIAVMASNLPQYSRELIGQVVTRIFDALLPGGQMHLIGETLHDDRSGPIGPALWALNEALAGSTGVAHTDEECVSYLSSAGFVDVEVHEFVKGTLTRITGTRA